MRDPIGAVRLAGGVLLAFVLFTTSALAAKPFYPIPLPNLGGPANATLPPAKAKQLGREAYQSFLQHGAVETDPELSTYIQKLGHRLAVHTGRNPSFFHYFVVRDNTVNSFALPGGYIAIQTGLIPATHTVSELAAVMGHETGHEVQNHIARRMAAEHVINWETAAAVVAAIAAGGASPDAVAAAMGGGASSLFQRSMTFSRSEEMEADHVGIRLLAAAGYNPYGMVTFFQRLEKQSDLYGNIIPPILQSHPVDSVRIAEAELRASQYPPTHLHPNLEYELMKARDEVLSADQISDAVAEFRKRHRDHPHSAAAAYGYAIALARAGHEQHAERLLMPLVQGAPGNVHYQLALARVQVQMGDMQQALARFRRLNNKMPKYEPVAISYATALLHAHQPSKAREVIQSSNVVLSDEPQVQELLARAAAQEGRSSEAIYEQAVALDMEGEHKLAMRQLRVALKMPGLDADARARIKAKMKEIRHENGGKDAS